MFSVISNTKQRTAGQTWEDRLETQTNLVLFQYFDINVS